MPLDGKSKVSELQTAQFIISFQQLNSSADIRKVRYRNERVKLKAENYGND
jgi:hypothetical protein